MESGKALLLVCRLIMYNLVHHAESSKISVLLNLKGVPAKVCYHLCDTICRSCCLISQCNDYIHAASILIVSPVHKQCSGDRKSMEDMAVELGFSKSQYL